MSPDTLSLLTAVFESTADGILIVDHAGKVLHANRRFQELWRIPDKLMATRDDDELLRFILDQLSRPELFIAKVKELYLNTNAISEDTISFKDGRFFGRYSRPLLAGDEVIGRVWSFRDVTVQKRSEEAFAAITNLSPDIITIMAEDGSMVFNSSAAERIHGYANHELLGKNTFEFIHPEDKEVCLKGLSELTSDAGKSVTVQYRYLNKDGSYIWMEATASNQISNPLINGLVVISRDISKRKLMEEELSDALKVKDDFISIITHELKTPVTSIKLQLQMLLRSGKPVRQTEHGMRSENLPAMIGQVNSLERLIDDLLQVTRIRNAKLAYEMKDEDLSLIIKQCSERHHELLNERKCQAEINIEDGIRSRCDGMRIEQVLVNLLSNVARYAPGRPVSISLRRNGDNAELRVKDNGDGIPQERQKDLFKLFSRISENHVQGGLGVGLYISASIINQHQGTIEVISSPGKGSEFILRLPAL